MLFKIEPCSTCKRTECQAEGNTVECLRIALMEALVQKDALVKALSGVRQSVAAMNAECARLIIPVMPSP